MNWREEWRAFARFVRAPRRLRGRVRVGEPWVARLLALGGLTSCLAIVLDMTIVGPLQSWSGARSLLPEQITPWFLFGALVWAPIVEELVFRAGMRQADYAIGFGPLVVALLAMPWNSAVAWVVFAMAAVALLAANRLLVWRVYRRPGARFRVARWFIARYAWIFWLYTVGFGLAHVANFDGITAHPWVLPLLVLPQLLMSVTFGYLRLRDGLRSSVLVHLLGNTLATVLLAAGY